MAIYVFISVEKLTKIIKFAVFFAAMYSTFTKNGRNFLIIIHKKYLLNYFAFFENKKNKENK